MKERGGLMIKNICKRCGHNWYKRTPKLPKVCPQCKTPYWNDEKKSKIKGGNKK